MYRLILFRIGAGASPLVREVVRSSTSPLTMVVIWVGLCKRKIRARIEVNGEGERVRR